MLDSARAAIQVECLIEEIDTPKRTIGRCQKADLSRMSDSQIFYRSDVQNIFRLETDALQTDNPELPDEANVISFAMAAESSLLSAGSANNTNAWK